MRTIQTFAWALALTVAHEAVAQTPQPVPGPDPLEAMSKKQQEDQKSMEEFSKRQQRDREEMFRNLQKQPLNVRPLEPGAAKPRPQAAPAAPPPRSRVTYGETRKLSGPRELPVEEEAKAKPAAAKPPAPEKPPCVFKPVMTDAELAACR